MTRRIFITGTGTDIGKTYVSALIMKELLRSGVNAAYFKAAMSGNLRDDNGALIPGDALHVKEVSGTSQALSGMCPYVYEAAYSPHLAAKLEGNAIDYDVVMKCIDGLSAKYDVLLMEGSGGIMCPLRLDDKCIWLEDFVRAGGFECLLVADSGLGTINSVGLTAYYMKSKGLKLSGIIFNNYEPGNVLHDDNAGVCEALAGVKVIARVRHNDNDINIIGRL